MTKIANFKIKLNYQLSISLTKILMKSVWHSKILKILIMVKIINLYGVVLNFNNNKT